MTARSSVAVALLAIGVDIGLARLGYGLLLPAIRAQLGGAYGLYGAIGAAHLGGYLAGTIAGARLMGRVALPTLVVAAHAGVALGLGASALAHEPIGLGTARVLVGLASGIGIAAAVTDALERVPVARRGTASGIAWAGIGIGLIVSAPCGQWALADAERWRTATWAFAGAAVAVMLAALAVRGPSPAHAPARSERAFRWRDLASRRYAAFVGAYTCFGIAYISYATFAVAAFARRGIVGGTLTGVWLALGIAAAGGAVGIGRILSSRLHRFALALPMAAGTIGCLCALRDETAIAIAGAVAVGSSLAATPGVASAFARERSDTATAARAFAAVTTCFGIGQMIGPVVSGALADVIGLRAAPLVGAAVYGVGTLLALADAAGRRVSAR